jgi:hypothetical protein
MMVSISLERRFIIEIPEWDENLFVSSECSLSDFCPSKLLSSCLFQIIWIVAWLALWRRLDSLLKYLALRMNPNVVWHSNPSESVSKAIAQIEADSYLSYFMYITVLNKNIMGNIWIFATIITQSRLNDCIVVEHLTILISF